MEPYAVHEAFFQDGVSEMFSSVSGEGGFEEMIML
jgi:hypothetical protein